MDTDAILKRNPKTVLIDEYDAATNKLGKAQSITNSHTGNKIAVYKTREGSSFAITAKLDSDEINGFMFSKDGDLGNVMN